MNNRFTPKFFGEVRDGKLKIKNRDAFMALLARLGGKKIWIAIDQISSSRSLQQNAYYWGGVLTPIAEHTGHTSEELHEIFKRIFLPPQFIEYRGQKIKVPGTTTKLNTVEFSEYVERIISEAAEMKIRIGTPDEYYAS